MVDPTQLSAVMKVRMTEHTKARLDRAAAEDARAASELARLLIIDGLSRREANRTGGTHGR